jgi:hypothetical protein
MMFLSAGIMTPYWYGNYTVDTGNVAVSQSLDALGVLLLLLNAAFVLLMFVSSCWQPGMTS